MLHVLSVSVLPQTFRNKVSRTLSLRAKFSDDITSQHSEPHSVCSDHRSKDTTIRVFDWTMRFWIVFVIILIICEIGDVSEARRKRPRSRTSTRKTGRTRSMGRKSASLILPKCDDCARLFKLPARFTVKNATYTYAHVSTDHFATLPPKMAPCPCLCLWTITVSRSRSRSMLTMVYVYVTMTIYD